MTLAEKYGEPHGGLRMMIVGGFIVEMKAIGMATHNDEVEKRAQLEAADPTQLALLHDLINYHKNRV